MLHIVTSYIKQNKNRKQTLESAQYGLEISFKHSKYYRVVVEIFENFVGLIELHETGWVYPTSS